MLRGASFHRVAASKAKATIEVHAQAAEIAQAEGGDAMNHPYEGDLHLIMMAVQKLVDEMLPPD